MWRPHQGSLPEKRRKVQKLVQKQARGPSQKFVLRVDRFLEIYADKGLDMFQNESQLEGAGWLVAARTGKEIPEAAESLGLLATVASLTLCTDQEQLQMQQ